eukprot:m.187940 g.187940  ORF g.187940 m.187940 type:complete len:61 (+) comp18171_c0_seq8:33-215(+)
MTPKSRRLLLEALCISVTNCGELAANASDQMLQGWLDQLKMTAQQVETRGEGTELVIITT